MQEFAEALRKAIAGDWEFLESLRVVLLTEEDAATVRSVIEAEG